MITPQVALRQFKAQARKANRLIQSGELAQLPVAERSRLMQRLRQLYQALQGRFSQRRLQRVLAGAALFIGIGTTVQAQNFATPVVNPFGLTPAGSYFVQPEAADLDGDGDLDIFLGDDYSSFQFYENTGTATAPAFSAPADQAFGLDSVQSYYGFLALADMDNDGDLDAFVGDDELGVFYYVNIGTAMAPNFDGPFTDTLGITTTPYLQTNPELVDLDDDGDYDLVIGNYYGQIVYHENTGDSVNAMFAAGDTLPFGIAAPAYYALSSFGDLDQDGDYDLLYSTYPSVWTYQENTGTAAAPAFGMAQTNPFGLQPGAPFAQPMMADFDGDGDLDVLHSQSTTIFSYYENVPGVGVDDELAGFEMSLAPNPAADFVRLRVEGGHLPDEVKIEVYSLEGKRVLMLNATANGGNLDETIPVSLLAPGAYVVRMLSGDKVWQERFTRQ